MVDELLAVAEGAGVKVREETLSGGDFPARGGLVTMAGKQVLFIDRSLTYQEKADLIAGALRSMDLDNVYLSPAARSLIQPDGTER